MPRILCVWSPTWAIANWKRRNPAASPAEAFALVQTERGVRRLAAVDAGAAALGLFAGQKATDAKAFVPGLATAEADPAADAAALAALADWCARVSPAVALDPPDGLVIDIAGVAHLWGGEAALARDIIARLARAGLPIRVAIADTPGAAWALSRFGGPGSGKECFDPARAIIPAGAAAAYLHALPIAALRLEPAAAAQIVRLGLATIGTLAALPRDQVVRRFGPAVGLRLDQALGLATEALTFRRPPNPWIARLAFADPISAPEDLARVTTDIAMALCARLEAAGQGAQRFELAFHRLDGVDQRLMVGLALPGRDAQALARLFAPRLETVDPGFGIEVVTLAAQAVAPIAARQRRLDPERPEPGAAEEALAPLIDRLTNRLGRDAVWRAKACPSHDPGRAVTRVAPFSRDQGDDQGVGGWDPARPRPLRLFRSPEPIEAVAPAPDDPPIFFRWRGMPHRVRRAEGPERLAEEWWRRPLAEADPAGARDYYRVEDEAGARFWLFRDGPYQAGAAPRWWMHGLFG